MNLHLLQHIRLLAGVDYNIMFHNRNSIVRNECTYEIVLGYNITKECGILMIINHKPTRTDTNIYNTSVHSQEQKMTTFI
jgi:hypothetical protein